MSGNENKSTFTSEIDIGGLIIAYSTFPIITIGLVFNTSTLILICLNKSLNKISTMVFICFVSVTDTLSLFTWNIDHYYRFNFYEIFLIYLYSNLLFFI